MRDTGEDRPVWAWIDIDALRHNARRAIACADGRAVIGVVKADGYGHGAASVARGLLAEGVSRLAVVSVGEGAQLRQAGIVAPILLLGGLDDATSAERALKLGLTPVIHDQRGFELARGLSRHGSPLSVEVEIDTGMRRMGVPASEALVLLGQIESTPQLGLSGVFTHLAGADESDPQGSREQAEQFRKIMADHTRAHASSQPLRHVVNSAGLFRLAELEDEDPESRSAAVRPGLMLYGVSPFVDRSAESLDLEPVMTLAARVVSLRSVSKGDAVGYGGSWRATRATRIATLPLGYADGLPRALGGRGQVCLGGVMCPIVGRVSMDYVTIDVGQVEEGAAAVGQVATLFGTTAEGLRVPVEDLAAAAGTIGYEMLVGVGARVPREVGDGPPPSWNSDSFDRAV